MNKLPFDRNNYKWMIIGVLTLVVGFTIMTLDKDPHGFGFFGLTFGPLVVLVGFLIELFAILQTPKREGNA